MKREARLDAYDEAKRTVRERDGGRCVVERIVPEVRCGGPIDPHHLAPTGRAPELWTDPNNIVSACRRHHDWIHHEDPVEAKARGLLVDPDAPRDD